MPRALTVSRDAARWGLDFYRHHPVLVLALSTVPTVQRFVSVRWGDTFPLGVDIALETATGLCRVALFAAVLALGLGRDPRLAGLGASRLWTLFGDGITRHRRPFAVQFLVLAAAFTAFDVLPNLAVAAWVAPEQQGLVTALLVAAKNPTVIAFTFLWLVGVARVFVLSELEATAPAGD